MISWLWGFAVAVAHWPGLLSASYVPRWAVIAIGAPLVSRLDWGELFPAARYFLLVGWACAAISTAWSPDQWGAVHDLIFLTFLCGAFIAGAGFDRLDDLMRGLALGLCVSVAISLAQWQANARPVGLFFNSEPLAEILAPVIVWAAIEKRWGYALVLSSWFLLMLPFGSRVAYAAIGIGLFYGWRSWPLRYALAGSAAFALTWLTLGSIKFWSGGLRVVIWGATAMAVTPMGQGLGWFTSAHPHEEFAHSDVLQAVAELGLGAIPFLFIPIMAFSEQRGSRGERAAFVAICVEAVVSFPLHMPATGFLAAVLAGYLASRRPRLRMDEHLGRAYDGPHLQGAAVVGTAHAGS